MPYGREGFVQLVPHSERVSIVCAGRSQTTITARIFRPIRPQKDKETVERGERSQAKREKKLIPYDQKLFDSIPGKSKKMFDARNVPREGEPWPSLLATSSSSMPFSQNSAPGSCILGM